MKRENRQKVGNAGLNEIYSIHVKSTNQSRLKAILQMNTFVTSEAIESVDSQNDSPVISLKCLLLSMSKKIMETSMLGI